MLSIHDLAEDETKEKESPNLTTHDLSEIASEKNVPGAKEGVAEDDTQPSTTVAEVDGGTRAWLQVVGSFLVFGNLWGPSFAYGNFQSYYKSTYIPESSSSDIAWICTFSIFLLIFGGVISGPLFDLGYFRMMLIAGAIIETLGLFFASISTTYWQLFLSQGLMMGLGNALLYIPGLTLVGRSFKKNRSIAMSITTCGAPVGGVILTLIFEQLIKRMSFGDTVRVMAYYMLGSYCIAFPLCLWGARNLGSLGGTKRRLFDKDALKDVPFLAFSFTQIFTFLGYLVPFLYLPSFGQFQIGQTQTFSSNIIIISQASSIVGRLLSGWLAGQFGVMLPWSVCALSSGIFCLAWAGVTTQGGYVAIAVLYGCFSGALIPLPPSIFPVVCPDKRVLGTRLGMAQAFSAFGSLLGGPIAGALVGISSSHNKFLGVQLFSGSTMVIGGLCCLYLWTLLVKTRGAPIFV